MGEGGVGGCKGVVEKHVSIMLDVAIPVLHSLCLLVRHVSADVTTFQNVCKVSGICVLAHVTGSCTFHAGTVCHTKSVVCIASWKHMHPSFILLVPVTQTY